MDFLSLLHLLSNNVKQTLMTKLITGILMITCWLLAFGACQNSSNAKNKDNNKPVADSVVKLSYHHYGGMGGLDKTLSITQSSICYSYSLYIDSSNNRRCDMPTDEQVWAKLMAELDVETFKKIKSRGSRLPVDGTDREFAITMASGETYSFINAEDEEHFKMLQPFFDHIAAIVNECNVADEP